MNSPTPPDGLPRYRLYGSPAATFDGQRVIVAQALLWPAAEASQPASTGR